jgi:archaemetzincin
MSDLILAPLGEAPGEVVERIGAPLEQGYKLRIRRIGPLPEPEGGYDGARRQWNSMEVLKHLLKHTPAGGARVLGVTVRDLFVPVLSFVYGQAQLRGRVAVISLARLRPEFYGLPGDSELVATRAAKEAVHEVGHLFGLVHCPDRRCPMSLSVGLEELDSKTAEHCPSCSALLRGSLEMHPRSQSVKPGGAGR